MTLTLLAPIIGKVLERIIPDPVERDKAEAELTKAVQTSLAAETRSESWLARTWRPWLMFCTSNLVIFWGVNNFIIAPWLQFYGINIPTVQIPAEFWHLITLGFGVYGSARTFEKISDNVLKYLNRKY